MGELSDALCCSASGRDAARLRLAIALIVPALADDAKSQAEKKAPNAPAPRAPKSASEQEKPKEKPKEGSTAKVAASNPTVPAAKGV